MGALFARTATALEESAALADSDADRAERNGRLDRARLERHRAGRAREAARRTREYAGEAHST